jgi:hypothetical protein
MTLGSSAQTAIFRGSNARELFLSEVCFFAQMTGWVSG